jgi:uncharacterized protein YndB with AHSA1/START domain
VPLPRRFGHPAWTGPVCGAPQDRWSAVGTVSETVLLSQLVRASPERIWDACAQPKGMRNWQADEVEGRVAPGQRLALRWPALGASIELTVAELDMGRRLVLQAGRCRVTVTVQPGSVKDETEGVASSWRVALALLAHHLEQHPLRGRHVSWFLQSVRTSAAAAHVFFTEPSALRTWLAPDAEPLVPAGPVRMRLAWGERLTGRVLAHTAGRDVALSWEEQEQSVLVLRTLPSPRYADERLVAAVWSYWGEQQPPPQARKGLAMAVRRLAGALASRGTA